MLSPDREVQLRLDQLLSERPNDLHSIAARTVLGQLAEAFSYSGLALCGSVCGGTHHPASDLDLLLVDTSIRRDGQLSALLHGVGIALVCLRADGGEMRARKWALQIEGESRLVTLVRSSYMVRDPQGSWERVHAEAELAARQRCNDRPEVRMRLRELANEAAESLRAAPEMRARRNAMRLAAILLEEWMVTRGAGHVLSKADEQKLRAAMEEEDPSRYRQLMTVARNPTPKSLLALVNC